MHKTGIINSHEVLVMPKMPMREDDKDYAVSFAVATDSEGITIIVISCRSIRGKSSTIWFNYGT